MRRPVVALLALFAASMACQVRDRALSRDAHVDSAADLDGAGAAPPDAPARDARIRPDAPKISFDGLPSAFGEAQQIGCADGSREGFLDAESWPRIAGCAGAFQVAGLGGSAGRDAHCSREAGNHGPTSDGKGCAVADLCAAGWHVCRDGAEVEEKSPTACESVVPVGQAAFFLVLGGASVQGLCNAGGDAANDLHGCGTVGQPEVPACHPLVRRMGFADCLATNGVWRCGGPGDHLRETEIVTKHGAALGGALCCRD